MNAQVCTSVWFLGAGMAVTAEMLRPLTEWPPVRLAPQCGLPRNADRLTITICGAWVICGARIRGTRKGAVRRTMEQSRPCERESSARGA
jgi:hypothetical protein